jgi:hypothetical protein
LALLRAANGLVEEYGADADANANTAATTPAATAAATSATAMVAFAGEGWVRP